MVILYFSRGVIALDVQHHPGHRNSLGEKVNAVSCHLDGGISVLRKVRRRDSKHHHPAVKNAGRDMGARSVHATQVF